MLFALLSAGCGGGNSGNPSQKSISISIAPLTAKVVAGQGAILTVTAVNTGIIWPEGVAGSYTRVGNIATYTPPSVEGVYDFTVTASEDITKKATAKITVESEVLSIMVFPKSVTLREGMEYLFVVDARPEQTVSWNVSSDCGTITQNGKFFAQDAGTCALTASIPGNIGDTLSADAEITVLAGAANTGTLSVAALAESLDLPASEFAQCYEGEAVDAVNASINEGSSIFNVSGTPGNVLLNRRTGAYRVVGGASAIDIFESALADILAGNSLPRISAANVEKILTNAHYYGNPNAEIVVLIYSDFLCPFCKRHHSDQTVETLTANHPAEVAMVFKNYPLAVHQTAELAAAGLYCAGKLGGDDAYYSFIAQAIQAGSFTG